MSTDLVGQMIAQAAALRDSSDDLRQMLLAGEKELLGSAKFILSVAQSSASGRDAAAIVNAAAHAVKDAVESLSPMKQACEDCIKELER